jgi:hypothetical protein
MAVRKRLLILYDHNWLHIQTTVHHLESFHRHSEYSVSYVSSHAACEFDLDYFDAVLIHYSVRICFPGFLSPSFAKALRSYRGVKALMLQDEYDATDAACNAIEDLGIGVVFTCVPEPYIHNVYPHDRFAQLEFVNVLTGYVPSDLAALPPCKPMRDRPIVIGYRGRTNHFWYGDLGQEKVEIGRRMKAICDERGLKTDIAWREEGRIYGDDWFRFLGSCKATLGTESGSNVFDRDGSIARKVQGELARNPAATYEQIRAKYLDGVEGRIVMNQISPKFFEAIACGTALILFEGQYSGVLEADKHFIPLKKDFSNVDDVLRRVQDDSSLEAMTRRAFQDVIASGKYSYQAFVRLVDAALSRHVKPDRTSPPDPWLPLPPCDALPAFRNRYQRHLRVQPWRRVWQRLPAPLRSALSLTRNRQRLRKLWAASRALLLLK